MGREVLTLVSSGECWLEVAPPEAEGGTRRLKQVAVGLSVVWAVASDGSVWFRRGISIPDKPAGSGWVQMVGDMAQVSVGSDNQVALKCQCLANYVNAYILWI